MQIKTLTTVLKHPEMLLQHGFPGCFFSDRFAIRLLYKKRFGCYPNLDKPRSFNEKVLWLSLHDRRPEYIIMVDKYRAKDYIKNKIGEELCAKNLKAYNASSEIDFSELPNRFVLKCNHDSGSVVVCKDRIPNSTELLNLDKSLKKNYFWFSREWPYKNVKPLIFAEEFIEGPSEESGGLIDYKLYCMNGKANMFCLISNRSKKANLTFVDIDWNYIDVRQRYDNHIDIPQKPDNYDKMIKIAEKLSQDIPFLRVDFFEDVNHKLYVGELTFTPSSGLIPFEPNSFDKELGALLYLPTL